MCKNHTHSGSTIKRSAQSSCRYDLKNGLSVVGEFSWRYLWACVTGKLRSYSQPTFTSISRKTRLSSAFSVYSASRPRSRLQPQA
ncbi:hypothetical protein BYT27DRAFT_7179834 [Phlegmacium glaucopus]|nr:hypothetical protein BYT27DRAFT_7179834 [Phlegmacium glaucopus]